MSPNYTVNVWREGAWWVAQVVAASGGADASVLTFTTQAHTLAEVEPMVRDLIATILDTEDDTSDLTFEVDTRPGGEPA